MSTPSHVTAWTDSHRREILKIVIRMPKCRSPQQRDSGGGGTQFSLRDWHWGFEGAPVWATQIRFISGEVTGVEEAELGRLESEYDVRFPKNQQKYDVGKSLLYSQEWWHTPFFNPGTQKAGANRAL